MNCNDEQFAMSLVDIIHELLTSVVETRLLLEAIVATSLPDALPVAKAETKEIVARLLDDKENKA
jgi:hypothetical protein